MKINRDLFADIVLVALTGLVIYEPNRFLVILASLAFVNHTLRWALSDFRVKAQHIETLDKAIIKIDATEKTVHDIAVAHNAMVKQYEHTKKLMSDMQLASAFVPRAKRREGTGQVA